MNTTEIKYKFIELRAAGYSYEKISKELHISKSTCSKYDTELAQEIAKLKGEQLSDLYDAYYMTREARIKKLGGTLERINDALDKTDLAELSPDKLLEYKLKYEDALKEECIYTGINHPLKDNFNEKDVLNAMADLLTRIQTGQVSPRQAHSEMQILQGMIRAYEDIEIKAKIDMIDAILNGRIQQCQ